MAKNLVTTVQRKHVHLNKDTNRYYSSGKYFYGEKRSKPL